LNLIYIPHFLINIHFKDEFYFTLFLEIANPSSMYENINLDKKQVSYCDI